jgi:hypothetical protein
MISVTPFKGRPTVILLASVNSFALQMMVVSVGP